LPDRPAIQPLRGWLPLIVLPAVLLAAAPAEWPRWVVMWTLAWLLYAGCKWLTWRRTPVAGATPGRQLGYLFAWPGLDAPAFLDPTPLPASDRPTPGEWALAAFKTALGIGAVYGLVREMPSEYPLGAGWVGMIGLALALHFGVFHLLGCAWRSAGVDAAPIMNRPFAATSLADFWGRRWNTAFRDLTHRFLFRPAARRLGPRSALAVGFLFSGLLHDLVISVSAEGGYGGPTLYFVIQGAAVFVERSRPGRRIGLGRGWRGWLFAAVVLAGPAYILFHPPFVRDVILPFLAAIGAT
jgi:alginate O-acetyltransferase complex protein AlgI